MCEHYFNCYLKELKKKEKEKENSQISYLFLYLKGQNANFY